MKEKEEGLLRELDVHKKKQFRGQITLASLKREISKKTKWSTSGEFAWLENQKII